MGPMRFGPTWSMHGKTTSDFAVSELPELKKMVVQTAMKKLFDEKYFSICTVRKIAELIGAPKRGAAWSMLETLHCIDYADMPDELRESIPYLINECLAAKQEAMTDTCIALNGVFI